MGQLDSALDNADLETLVEAMGDWEAIGNHEYHVMNWIKNCPVPAEDSETHQYIVKLKELFKQREKEIKDMREVRQERAIFLKAKLMLIKRDLGIDQLFDNASRPTPAATPTEAAPIAPSANDEMVAKLKQQLSLAEYYMKDIGIWDRFEKYVESQTQKAE